jgi:signal transduction histidine kinase
LLEAASSVNPLFHWPSTLVRVVGDVSLAAFLFLFPTGTFVPSWTRWLVVGWVATQVPTEFLPGTTLDSNTWPPVVFLSLVGGLLISGIAVQFWRYRRRSGSVERQQTKWVVYGLAVALAGNSVVVTLVNLVGGDSVPPGSALWLFAFVIARALLLVIPISVGVAVLRFRLWDVDVLINRALVYAALTACVIGIYVVVVGYLGLVFRSGDNLVLSLIGTACVAVLFQPLRVHLQRVVNRLLYGQRDEPYAVLSRLSRRLEASLSPRPALAAVVQSTREAFKLPYAALSVRQAAGPEVAVASGTPTAEVVRIPLVYQQEMVGELMLAPRAPGETFGGADRRLLDDLARQAASAAHALRLSTDLQRSRERLVATREEERRRIRRDLHDGLGPQLASQTLTIDAIRALLVRDAAAADELLSALKAQSQGAVAEIRRLVYGLRPPTLDDLGLVEALREESLRCTHAGLAVHVEIDGNLEPVSAAAEVAVFRIAQEALTNVVRHANAASVAVRLGRCGEQVCLEVVDDGRGVAEGRRAGVGLTSMRERAEELGGECQVESLHGGGTRVVAHVPLTPVAALEPAT